MNDVTLVVTSCNRHELLEKTLRSFSRMNSYPIAATVVVEDSELDPPDWFSALEGLGEKKWITNGVRKGQLYSIDRAYAEVRTPWIMHCEDDWEFAGGGFIERSLELLQSNPHLWTLSLRGANCNGHPLADDDRFPVKIHEAYWRGGWGGCHFNPGLRRLEDWRQLGGYGRHAGYDASANLPGELHLSRLHLDRGFRIGVLPECVRHLGLRSRAAERVAAPPKVLIAVPACHAYQYGTYKDRRIGHVDAVSYERVRAVRETWAKYLPAFETHVHLRFFYGQATDGRQPFNDEIFLDVPDDYTRLPFKVKAILQWALGKGYEYVFKADDDTFVYLDRLMASGFEGCDYLGYCYPSHGNYISGGCGYWLSRRAMQAVVLSTPETWAEDAWVGQTLAKAGIRPTRDGRYLPGFAKHYVELERVPADHSYISMHACTPEMMHRLYSANPAPNFRPVFTPLNEGYEDKGRNYPLNIKRREKVFNASSGPAPHREATDGAVGDPRRDHRSEFVSSQTLSAGASALVPETRREGMERGEGRPERR